MWANYFSEVKVKPVIFTLIYFVDLIIFAGKQFLHQSKQIYYVLLLEVRRKFVLLYSSKFIFSFAIYFENFYLKLNFLFSPVDIPV